MSIREALVAVFIAFAVGLLAAGSLGRERDAVLYGFQQRSRYDGQMTL